MTTPTRLAFILAVVIAGLLIFVATPAGPELPKGKPVIYAVTIDGNMHTVRPTLWNAFYDVISIHDGFEEKLARGKLTAALQEMNAGETSYTLECKGHKITVEKWAANDL